MSETLVAVEFEEAGRPHHYFDGGLQLELGDEVVAETPRGLELGRVIKTDVEPLGQSDGDEVKPVTRRAEEADHLQQYMFRLEAAEAFEIAREKIADHNLPMKLLETHYTLDGNRIVFFFAADGRVDFRQLVRDLVATFRRRIELHQVGARDRAKITGGMGPCGRECCCSAWLREFAPVSIKMTKEQGLSLNPTKISGACGRLMCCLRYEYETYRKLRSELPRVGSTLKIPEGEVKVVEVHILSRTLTVQHPELGVFDIPAGRALEGLSKACDSCSQGKRAAADDGDND